MTPCPPPDGFALDFPEHPSELWAAVAARTGPDRMARLSAIASRAVCHAMTELGDVDPRASSADGVLVAGMATVGFFNVAIRTATAPEPVDVVQQAYDEAITLVTGAMLLAVRSAVAEQAAKN